MLTPFCFASYRSSSLSRVPLQTLAFSCCACCVPLAFCVCLAVPPSLPRTLCCWMPLRIITLVIGHSKQQVSLCSWIDPWRVDAQSQSKPPLVHCFEWPITNVMILSGFYLFHQWLYGRGEFQKIICQSLPLQALRQAGQWNACSQ